MDQSGAKQEKLADRGNGAQPVRTGAQKGGILAEGGRSTSRHAPANSATTRHHGNVLSSPYIWVLGARVLDFDQTRPKMRGQLTILRVSSIKRPDRVRHSSGRARCAARGSVSPLQVGDPQRPQDPCGAVGRG
jgi:hypothetical protein